MPIRIAITFLFLSCAGVLSATPVADLASPSQNIRDSAAKIVRATYSPHSRTNWDSLVSALKIGSSETNVQAQLQSLNLHSGGGAGSGNTETETYRLDDLWLLECSFTNTATGSGLAHLNLVQQLRDIWVEPPTKFTGVWTTYYANGQPSHEFHYANGIREGRLTTFYPNGSICYVCPQHSGVSYGEEKTYYPSGKIEYKGQYKLGKQTGHWIWYKEDGSIESQEDY